MRTVLPIAALLLLSLNIGSVRAASPDSSLPDQQSLEALEARANQAQPREQCVLYAQLVQQMTELSIRQYQAGEVSKATGLLQQIQRIAKKIHLSVNDNDKRLKNAELMLSHTAFRLSEMVQASNIEDRPLVEQTLAQVTDAKNAALMQVFRK
ncbi:MAG TPA: hypothetical protein VGG45_09840 [Terracidiphilus sp.]|jgi:hypothetical protein